MKVLILGSGAKEHAIVWKLAQSRRTTGVYVNTGNDGMQAFAHPLSLPLCDAEAIYRAYLKYEIDVIFIATETPKCFDLVDQLQNMGATIIGTPLSSLVFNDKHFLLDFAERHNIPMPETHVYTDIEALEADADKLLAKSSCILKSCYEMSSSMLHSVSDKKELMHGAEQIFGGHNDVIVQESISGVPVTLTAFVDHSGYLLFPACSEYSRVDTKSEARITGGLGAIAPSPYVNPIVLDRIIARLNDPATQAIMPLVKSDFVDILAAMLEDKVDEHQLSLSRDMAVSVVVASKGYPHAPELAKPVELSFDYADDNSVLFYGAVAKEGAHSITSGGRPFTATGWARTIAEANNYAYKRSASVAFEGAWSRQDIGTEFFEDIDV